MSELFLRDVVEVKITITVEDCTGTPPEDEEPVRATKEWSLETIEYALNEHGSALQRAPSDGRVTTLLVFTPRLNGRKEVSVLSRQSDITRYRHLENVFAEIDPRMWTQRLLQTAVGVGVGALPTVKPPDNIESAVIRILRKEP